ncbi:methylenetetrahydrofolate reductase [Lipomyces doorenjongii]|uniref:methylenetetrahydrofolate reductase n=1 Tax=Lipomyces doorenjongii TaxID=383834 RepID=UPI0034CF5EF9
MRVSEVLQDNLRNEVSSFSFEYFVPKTAQGVQNLCDRIDRMKDLRPLFADVTWNAGGMSRQGVATTTEMVAKVNKAYGLPTCMHLTCTGMSREAIDQALLEAYNGGCRCILALRGDPPLENEKWEATVGGFLYARDLVTYIREQYDDYFEVGVAGYPEGHPEEHDHEVLIDHLKEKLDAGASFVITQMFYDVDHFLDWVDKCREKGITAPIVPGIMPISNYASFVRRAKWCEINVPPEFMLALERVKDDDAAVREVGAELVSDMCKAIIEKGHIFHLHFYTMNLEKSTRVILERLGLLRN